MFDLGWTEMMLIGVVALIVVGPKELPTLFRAVGQAVGKARGMAREFSRAMEAAADEAGVKEIDRQIRAATRPVQFAADRIKEGVARPITSTPSRGPVPPAGTPLTPAALPATPPVPLEPLDPGPPLPATPALATVSPGGATEALALRRAEERAARAALPAATPAGPPAVPPADGAS